MAQRESRQKSRNWIIAVLACIAIVFCILSTIQERKNIDLGIPEYVPTLDSISDWLMGELEGGSTGGAVAVDSQQIDGALSVHYIDVGQAKAILIKAPEKNVLIDAGDNDRGQEVIRYLNAQGVETLDIAIGTHPHADHIGGMDTVINNMPVQTVILPTIPKAIVPTTTTYTDLLKAIKKAKLKITPSKPGTVYDLGEGVTLTILAPLYDYDDLNEMSVVCRLDYGETSFLFTGDASAASERDMLKSGENLQADVLDVGHHGSNTGSTENFLQAVKPAIAVISCGIDNSYGHPHREVMERLNERNLTILRTDLDGCVVIVSDGVSLGYSTEKQR